MFVEVTAEQVHYMKSDKIGIPHAFTTRYGGVSEGYLSSLNLGERRGRPAGECSGELPTGRSDLWSGSG